jgi:hypothetical protein
MFGNQQLRLNPSVIMCSKNNAVLEVKDNKGANIWVRYYEIKFHLLIDEYNDDSQYYSIWNMGGDGEEVKRQIQPIEVPLHDYWYQEKEKKTESLLNKLHREDFTLAKLLCADKASMKPFKDIEDIKKKEPYRLYITNSPIISMKGSYDVKGISISEAKKLIKSNEYKFVSNVSDAAIAEALTLILGHKIKTNKNSFTPKPNDNCIMVKIMGEFEEGKAYNEDDIKEMVSLVLYEHKNKG